LLVEYLKPNPNCERSLMHRRLDLQAARRALPTTHPVGLLTELRQAVNRLQVGEFTLIVQNESVIRIERAGNVCVYCDIPLTPTAAQATRRDGATQACA